MAIIKTYNYRQSVTIHTYKHTNTQSNNSNNNSNSWTRLCLIIRQYVRKRRMASVHIHIVKVSNKLNSIWMLLHRFPIAPRAYRNKQYILRHIQRHKPNNNTYIHKSLYIYILYDAFTLMWTFNGNLFVTFHRTSVALLCACTMQAKLNLQITTLRYFLTSDM